MTNNKIMNEGIPPHLWHIYKNQTSETLSDTRKHLLKTCQETVLQLTDFTPKELEKLFVSIEEEVSDIEQVVLENDWVDSTFMKMVVEGRDRAIECGYLVKDETNE